MDTEYKETTGADSGQSSFDTGDGYYQDNRNSTGYSDSGYDNGRQPVYEQQSGARRGFAIASLVMGIIGLVTGCCSLVTFGVLNILLGVAGLIFGILGLKSRGKGMAIAGIVMACLNIVIGILLMILMIISSQVANNMTPEEYNAIMQEMESLYGLEMSRIRSVFLLARR